jgi:hypothetical protein
MNTRVSIRRCVGFRIEGQSYQYLTESKKRESCEIHTIIMARGYMHDEAACIECCMQGALHELWKHFFPEGVQVTTQGAYCSMWLATCRSEFSQFLISRRDKFRELSQLP